MVRHPDFQRIFDAFMQHYCTGSKCTEGEVAYQTWLSKIGLDETKPYQRPQEKFVWAKDYIQFVKEDDKAKYFKIRALFPLTSMNNNLYTLHEVTTATKTLIGKPTDLNHTTELLPEVETVDADFEDKTVECIDRVQKGSKALELIESGQIIHVSIEADCLRGSEPTPEGNLCKGLVFTGKAYLTKDVLPGVPLTTIEPLEKIVEDFKVTNLTQEKGKEQKPPEKTDSQNQESFVEFRAELDAMKQRLGDLDTLKTQIQTLSDQIAKLTAEPEPQEPEPKTEKKDPKTCLCVLTKEGFWARFHQLRSEGLDKNDAFRLVSQEVLAAVEKKAQMQ